jgi:serine/threonine protein kinase
LPGPADKDQRPLTLPTRREGPRRNAQPSGSEDIPLQPGFLLGKYRIVRRLGAGGMGSVYEATHVDIGRGVAIKVLSEDLVSDARARARFLREAATASRLEHPHVVDADDYGTEAGVPFIVMELLRGEDLRRQLDRQSRGLPIEDAADIMLAVCAGVSAAHRAGVVHRDLKPGNIFLARTALGDTVPKVLDFGISKGKGSLVDASLTEPGTVLGTRYYISPEQVGGREADPRSDQYALGVVLYECLTGHRPYEGDSLFAVMTQIRKGNFPPPSRLRPELPGDLEAVVLRSMAPDPAARFPSVHAFGSALLLFASSKQRLLWADYYGPGPPDDKRRLDRQNGSLPRGPGVGPAPVSLVALTGAMISTRSLEMALAQIDSPAAAHEQPSETPGPVGGLPAAARRTRPPGRRHAWMLASVALLGLCTAGLVYLRTALAPSSIGPGQVIAEEPAVGGEPLLREARPAEPSPPQSDHVTIAIANAPPGLAASIDGKAVQFPLHLPRGTPARVVVFEAPAHEPREMTIDGREDLEITLVLRRRTGAFPVEPGRPEAANRPRKADGRGKNASPPHEPRAYTDF